MLSNGWTDWPQIGTHLQIHLGMAIRQTNCPSRHKGGTWVVLGVKHSKSGDAVKRLDRLAPTLVHVCGFISEWTQAKSKSPLNTPGGIRGGGGGHGLKILGKLSNGCNDWHQIWYTSVDSSGNGHRLNTIRPIIIIMFIMDPVGPMM